MNKPWFSRKSLIGLHMPQCWQGWLLYLAYIVFMILLAKLAIMLLGGVFGSLAMALIIGLLTVGMIAVMHAKIEGGWQDE